MSSVPCTSQKLGLAMYPLWNPLCSIKYRRIVSTRFVSTFHFIEAVSDLIPILN